MLERAPQRRHPALPSRQEATRVRLRSFPIQVPLAALLGAVAPASAAPPRFQVALEALALQPAGEASRGFGGGVQLAYRLTDRISLAADGGRLVSRKGVFYSFAGGLRAVLDSVPVAPFVGLSLAQLGPRAVAGMGAAIRVSVGADWNVAAPFSLGLELRGLTPLGEGSTASSWSDGGVALRLVFLPAFLR
jgi:hypothetical protein